MRRMLMHRPPSLIADGAAGKLRAWRFL
uniref:Uncharacterized protein n=1 Tax=Anguilla anguilla TaxID=7936 RepID=A0A0E9U5Z0_ANGAN